MEGYAALGQALGMMVYTALFGVVGTTLFIGLLIRGEGYSIRGAKALALMAMVVALSWLLAFALDNFLWDVLHIYQYGYFVSAVAYPITFLLTRSMFLRKNAGRQATYLKIVGVLALGLLTGGWLMESI